jgi:dihydrofolate reductase
MSKTVLYIATSLDGFIARPDGNLDWLTSTPNPESGDYGYTALLESIRIIIMGRRTYDEIIGFGVDWPYSGFDTYVVTKNRDVTIQSPDTYLLTGDLKTFVTELKEREEKDIWLVGGGQLITSFINADLLDKMIITIIPRIIGEGVPLFAGKPAETNWSLAETKSFNTGVVILTYERNNG